MNPSHKSLQVAWYFIAQFNIQIKKAKSVLPVEVTCYYGPYSFAYFTLSSIKHTYPFQENTQLSQSLCNCNSQEGQTFPVVCSSVWGGCGRLPHVKSLRVGRSHCFDWEYNGKLLRWVSRAGCAPAGCVQIIYHAWLLPYEWILLARFPVLFLVWHLDLVSHWDELCEKYCNVNFCKMQLVVSILGLQTAFLQKKIIKFPFPFFPLFIYFIVQLM